jgi:ribosomal protein S18 acetylase RimI-like enzyme
MARASEALDLPADRLGVVARLLVAPTARRGGVGRALLEVATHGATERGLWPVLEVAVQLPGAVRLYESSGWTPAGRVTVSFTDGTSLDELVFLGPPPATEGQRRQGTRTASVADTPPR